MLDNGLGTGRQRLAVKAIRAVLRVNRFLVFRPPWPLSVQRVILEGMSRAMPGESGVTVASARVGMPQSGLDADQIRPRASQPERAVLYLHGGAFCTLSPRAYRAITTRLAVLATAEVLAPVYRLAPEYQWPAQLEDALAAFQWLLDAGYAPDSVTIAGDSAGAFLALQLALGLRDRFGLAAGGLILLSPLIDPSLRSVQVDNRDSHDPVVDVRWSRMGSERAAIRREVDLLTGDLRDLPPMFIQIGEDEVLLRDTLAFAERATDAGNEVTCEVQRRGWHTYQIQAGLLQASRDALVRASEFVSRARL